VIGRPAESLENTKPFRTQGIATGCQLSTEARDVIQPTRDNAFYRDARRQHLN